MARLEPGRSERIEVLVDREETELVVLAEALDSVRCADEVLEVDDRDVASRCETFIRAIFNSGSSTKAAPTWRSSQTSGVSHGSTTRMPCGSRCRSMAAIAERSRSSVFTYPMLLNMQTTASKRLPRSNSAMSPS